MLIVNADDWGASSFITNTIMDCIQKKTVTSVSAMVFMEDSRRAADLAQSNGIDTGLHLNLTHQFTSKDTPDKLLQSQSRIISWLRSSKLAQIIYNPFLRNDFDYVFKCQYQEYNQLFKHLPLRIDGHNHMHLCANMLIDHYIPEKTCVRKNINFFYEEKRNPIYRFLRSQVDRLLAGRYVCTDFFFHVRQIAPTYDQINQPVFNKILNLAANNVIELLVHPNQKIDYSFLTCDLKKHITPNDLSSFSDYYSLPAATKK